MGITGLLPFVKKACYEGNLEEFRGKTLAVDVSCLLHRGVFGCAGRLAMGQDTELYIGYVSKYVKALLKLNCHVVLVFDGRALPAKRDVNESRTERRIKAREEGYELLGQGLIADAHKAFSRGSQLTRDIVENTIRTFNKVDRVDCLVAPYEADAQIAYLMQAGFAHAVVTEDSDLIVFGCEKIIFKMDPSNGFCVVYSRERLPNCVCPVLRRRFEFPTFRRICILSGCDYLQGGVQGIGLKGAEEIFAKTSFTNLHTFLARLPLYLNKRQRHTLPKRFAADFVRAENTFLHQIVYDPALREQRPLNPYPAPEEELKENCAPKPAEEDTMHYAGKVLTAQSALRLALGNMDLSVASLQDEFVLPAAIPHWSIWHAQFKSVQERTRLERERELDAKFGAFKPKRSPVKRPAAATAPVHPPQTVPRANATRPLREIDAEHFLAAKRTRYSHIQIAVPATKNGTCVKWDASEWMRQYCVDVDEGSDTGSVATGVSSSSSQGSC